MYFYATSQPFYNHLGNGKSQTTPLLKFIGLVEAVKNHQKFFIVNSFAGIFYVDTNLLMFLVDFTSQSNRSFFGKLVRIVKEVRDNLGKTQTVDIDR